GGPIIRDKLWLWGAYSNQQINLLTATLLQSGARFLDKTKLENESIKLNAQPFTSNSLSISDMYGNKVKLGRNVGPTRFPETSWNQSDDYNGKSGSLTSPTMWKIEDTQIIGSNLYLTGLYSKVQGGFRLIADNGVGCKDLACGLNTLPAYLGTDGAYHRSYESYDTIRPQNQYRVDGSTFFNTGSVNNELKFGFGYRKADVRSISVYPGDQYTSFAGFCDDNASLACDQGGVYLFRPTDFTYGVKSTDLYVGDTVMFGNVTVQAAVRYDQQKGNVAGGSIAGNSLLGSAFPAISWSSISGLKWTNVSPRLGLTYALGANKQTLIRADYSRYVDQMGGSLVYNVSPGKYQYLYYYFNDLNHNKIADPGEIDTSTLVNYNGVDHNKLTVANQLFRWDKDLKAPTTDEFILGFEHQLLSDFSVGVNGTYRKLRNFVWNEAEHTQGKGDFYTSADYVLHAPPAVKLPDGTAVTTPYYVLAPGVPSPVYYDITNRPDYDQTYKGLELMATKRMSNRWMLRGNLTLQDWKQHIGAGGIIDPTLNRGSLSGAGSSPGWLTGCVACTNSEVLQGSGTGSGSKGGVYINSKWAYNLTGAYQIPIVETSLGFNLTGRQGYPIPYVYRVTTSEGFKYVLAEGSTDAQRHSNLTEVDLRLAKDIRVSRAGITLSVDAFNILNKNTILQRDVRRLQLASSNHITEVQSPRVFRLGARLTF
ncbi:MAG: outer membrane beta-barrel protein, partial [Thermoanaerobaculia bacterium]